MTRRGLVENLGVKLERFVRRAIAEIGVGSEEKFFRAVGRVNKVEAGFGHGSGCLDLTLVEVICSKTPKIRHDLEHMVRYELRKGRVKDHAIIVNRSFDIRGSTPQLPTLVFEYWCW